MACLSQLEVPSLEKIGLSLAGSSQYSRREGGFFFLILTFLFRIV